MHKTTLILAYLRQITINTGIALCILIFNIHPVYAINGDFPDVPPDHQNYAAIMDLKSRGIIFGYPDGTFKPEQAVNRAETLKIILLGSGTEVENTGDTAGFSDTKTSAWYTKFLVKALALGIIKGYPDGTFKP